MWSEDFDLILPVMMTWMMAALVMSAYRRQPVPEEQSSRGEASSLEYQPATGTSGVEPQPRLPDSSNELTPQQKEWAEKAVERYAEAQKKKWRRWNEAMFEPKTGQMVGSNRSPRN